MPSVIYIVCHIPFGIIILFLNIIINIISCSLPALWFVLYIIVTIFKHDKLPTTNRCVCRTIAYLCLLVIYGLTLRVQVGFYIFIARTFFYTIIVGFTGPPHIWTIYTIVITSLTYFATYFSQFIDSYNILLTTVFEIKAKTDSNTKETGSTDEGNAQTNSSTIQSDSIDAQNVQTNSITRQTDSIDAINVQTDSNTRQTVSIEGQNAETDSNARQTASKEKLNSKADSIEEHKFNYIVDNCYLFKKRLFLLIIKTTLTVIFLSVSLLILNITNNIDNNKNMTNILSYIMIIISPLIVSMLSKSNASEEIKMHMKEITELYIARSKTNNTGEIRVQYSGDAWYQGFSCHDSPWCAFLYYVTPECFQSRIVGLTTKALFGWSNITCDHAELLSLADIKQVPECHYCSCPSQAGYETIASTNSS